MKSEQELHVVFGAGGPLGDSIARQLADAGRRVRAVNRSGEANLPRSVQLVRGDATDPVSARAACAGATVVYHTANAAYDQWPARLPSIMAGLIDAAAAAGARLVYADNLYAYGPVEGAIAESAAMVAHGPKGATRTLVAEMLLAAHRDGIVRACIGRGADFYGPGVLVSNVGERFFGRAVAGRPIDVLGDPHAPHTYVYIDDFARALIILADHERALGEVWHVPSAPTISTHELIAITSSILERTLKSRVTRRWMLRVVGWFRPMAREVTEILYQFERPFVVDASKFERAFAMQTTAHPTAVARTLDWYRRRRVGHDPSHASN